MKHFNKFIKESTCGGYNSGDAEEIANALIYTCPIDIEDKNELNDLLDEDGYYTFDIDSAAEELNIDSGDLLDYLDNYWDRVVDYIIDNLPLKSQNK